MPNKTLYSFPSLLSAVSATEFVLIIINNIAFLMIIINIMDHASYNHHQHYRVFIDQLDGFPTSHLPLEEQVGWGPRLIISMLAKIFFDNFIIKLSRPTYARSEV